MKIKIIILIEKRDGKYPTFIYKYPRYILYMIETRIVNFFLILNSIFICY